MAGEMHSQKTSSKHDLFLTTTFFFANLSVHIYVFSQSVQQTHSTTDNHEHLQPVIVTSTLENDSSEIPANACFSSQRPKGKDSEYPGGKLYC